ncbi:unnamed protein product, partial [Laminaria digitata]
MASSIEICKEAGFDLIVLETAGIGQSDTEITELTDIAIYVMTHDFGAPTQLEKIGMLDVADFVVINKFEKRGSADALRDIRKQVQRNRGLFDQSPEDMPVFPTMASQFNDPGVTRLYLALLARFNADYAFDRQTTVYNGEIPDINPAELAIIPPKRQRYLGEVVDACRAYRAKAEQEVEFARKWGEAKGVITQLDNWKAGDEATLRERVEQMRDHWWNNLSVRSQRILEDWEVMAEKYTADTFTYEIR